MAETAKKPEARGVMNRMRQQTHIVLWILVFSFVGLIVFEWGMDILGFRSPTNQGVIVNVNGTEISYQDFWQRVQNQYVTLRNQLGTTPDEQYMRIVREQIFNAMVNDILLREAISDIGLFATDKDVIQEVRYRPRPEFFNNPEFQKEDGSFDLAKYESVLSQLAQINAADILFLEGEARNRIPEIKLQNLVNATVRITEEELRQAFREEEQTATAEYILAEGILYADVAIDITDQEVMEYYRTHMDDFFEEESRNLRYVIFDISPTSADSASIDTQIEEALKRAKAGEDFTELAVEYTDSDGDLGTFSKGSMVAEFESAVFADDVENGDILGPVETPFGKHIIKIERLVKRNGEIDSVQAKHILFQYEASTSTLESTETIANYFVITAQEEGFDKTAEQNDLTISTTPPFGRSGFIPGFGAVQEISNFAFRSEYNADNPPISDVIETPMGFIVFQLAAVNKARTKTLDDEGVRFEIEQALRERKQIQLAQNLMARIKSDIDSGTPFKDAAEKERLEVQSPIPFKINDYIPNIGYDIKFASEVFGLEPENVSPPVTGNKGVFLIKLIAKDPFDEELYTERRSEIITKLLQQKWISASNAWIQKLREKAKIEDFRDDFFLRY